MCAWNKYSIISNAWFRSILSVKIEKNYHKLQFFKKKCPLYFSNFSKICSVLCFKLLLKIDFPDGKGGSNQNAISVSLHHNIFLFISHLIFSCVFPETIFGECENFRHMNLYQWSFQYTIHSRSHQCCKTRFYPQCKSQTAL